ncbi:hypothetical protein HAX54_049619 [Datura stramonium]|uniref:Uncharacterized protein n=1 Tax=Datura stramonium TaxID=4076 RepID=A0ABS8SV47_DATST|nr:hypothetical protein [Datura stramonium]
MRTRRGRGRCRTRVAAPARARAPAAAPIHIRAESPKEDDYILEDDQVWDEGVGPDHFRSLAILGTRGPVLPVVTMASHPEVGVFLQRVFDHLLEDQFRQQFSRPREVILVGVTTVGDRVPRGILKYLQAIEVILTTLVLPSI